MNEKGALLVCEKCNRPVIERMTNGLFRFKYGRTDPTSRYTPVYIEIHGSVRIQCFRKDCLHMNTFDYFPKSGLSETVTPQLA
jgi:hypothetical protein